MKNKMIHKKTIIEYIDDLIEFYKTYETSDTYLRKLIVGNLQGIKRKYQKETKDAYSNNTNEITEP